MRLTIVGCSGSYPGPDSAASCYLLEAEEPGRTWRILLDLGSGALGALQRHVDPLTIDAVFLSHLHADHCLDLCGYHVLRRYHPSGAQPRIGVWGPTGTADRMARAYDLPADPGMHEEFEFAEYLADPTTAQPINVGPFSVLPVPVVHPVPAYALRVTAHGRTLTYSGDTGFCSALVEAATGCDLFLCEASFTEGADNPPGLHLTGAEAGEAARAAGAGSLMLTHVPPWHDPELARAEAAEQFQGPLSLARAAAVVEV